MAVKSLLLLVQEAAGAKLGRIISHKNKYHHTRICQAFCSQAGANMIQCGSAIPEMTYEDKEASAASQDVFFRTQAIKLSPGFDHWWVTKCKTQTGPQCLIHNRSVMTVVGGVHHQIFLHSGLTAPADVDGYNWLNSNDSCISKHPRFSRFERDFTRRTRAHSIMI